MGAPQRWLFSNLASRLGAASHPITTATHDAISALPASSRVLRQGLLVIGVAVPALTTSAAPAAASSAVALLVAWGANRPVRAFSSATSVGAAVGRGNDHSSDGSNASASTSGSGDSSSRCASANANTSGSGRRSGAGDSGSAASSSSSNGASASANAGRGGSTRGPGAGVGEGADTGVASEGYGSRDGGSCGGGGSPGGGAGTGGGARGGTQGGSAHPSLQVAAGSHYEVLGVHRDAPLAAIKAAFRLRAKELHPDVVAARMRRQPEQQRQYPHQHGHGPHCAAAQHQHPQPQQPQHQHRVYDSHIEASASAFLRIVAAYEALSNPSSRRAYDMQLSAAEAEVGRKGAPVGRRHRAPAASAPAAADGGAAAAAATDGSGRGYGGGALRHIDFRSWRYGVGEWMMRPRREPTKGRSAALEYYLRKYAHEFESQLHSALVHAYLGPKLDLQPGELPRCFEADLRRQPGLSDQLMHLVSGRTLLGVVRVKEPLRLGASPGAAAERAPPPPAAPKAPTLTDAEAAAPASVAPGQRLDTFPERVGTVPFSAVPSHGTDQEQSGRNVQGTTGAPPREQRTAPCTAPQQAGLSEAPAVAADETGTTAAPARGAELAAAAAAQAAVPEAARGMVSAAEMAPVAEVAAACAAAGRSSPSSPAVVADGGASASAAVTVAPDDRRGVDPLDVLDAAVIRGLSDDDVVQLAAASIARSDVAAAGYSRLVPGYSRLRGLLELQGFYPDPAALQRRSTQISLVTAAEGAQARDATASALGGRRLLGRWPREATAAEAGAPPPPSPPSAAAAPRAEEDRRGSGTEGGNRDRAAEGEVTATAAAAAAAGWKAAQYGEVPHDVMPPPQLQGLVEAARLAEAEEAAMAAAAAAAENTTAGSSPEVRRPPAPLNDPHTWLFGPDVSTASDVGTADDGVVAVTVLEMRVGQELAAVAVHQPPPTSQPPAAAVASAATAAVEDVIGAVRQSLAGRGADPGSSAAAGTGTAGAEPAPEGLMVPLFGPVIEGRLKVYIDGRLEAGVEGRHVYDAAGHKVALIVRGSFPGVSTIHFFDATTRRLRLLCRCVHARLLPSPTWLFPPREETHDVGGWYFEWGGYARRGQPGWVDPAVYVFVAALVTAVQERIESQRRRVVAELVDGWRQAAWRAVAGWWAPRK